MIDFIIRRWPEITGAIKGSAIGLVCGYALGLGLFG